MHRKLLVSLLTLGGAVALGACGAITDPAATDAGNNNNDDGGGGTDSNNVDAAPPDAGPGMITVRVRSQNDAMPLQGAKVAFNNPDGSTISVKTTDASGEATEVVPPGAIVTVGESAGSSGNSWIIRSVYGVQPGDTIITGPSANFDSNDIGSASITLGTAYGSATEHKVGTGCDMSFFGSTANPITYNFRNDRCYGTATTRDLLALAVDANDEPLAWTALDNVSTGSNVTTGVWNDSFNTVTVELQDMPFAGEDRIDISQIHEGVNFELEEPDSVVLTTGQDRSFQARVPPGFIDKVQFQWELDNDIQTKVVLIHKNLAPTTGTDTHDLGALGYPSIESVSYDSTTPARPGFRWNLDGSVPGEAEALLAFIFWSEANNNESWQWLALAPPGTSTPLIAPMLPADFVVNMDNLNRWPPPAAATIERLFVGLMERGDRADFAEIRTNQPFGMFFEDGGFLSHDAAVGTRSIVVAGGLLGNN